jgi:membrane fusion protein (multidrug efflux system)
LNARLREVAAAVLSTAAVLLGAVVGCAPGNVYKPPPPPEVTVSPPLRRSLTTYAEYTGTTKAVAQVDLRARVKGFLKEVRFQEGADVKAGDVLLVIDEEPYRVKVDEAKARLDEAEASLKKAQQSKAREVAAAQLALDQASLLLAQVEERRSRALLARNAASRDDVDRADADTKKNAAQVEADKANLEQARADFDTNVLAAQANVESARAALEDAKINLGYCRVASPVDGRISRVSVDKGNLVGDGDSTVLATVVKDDPVYAYVSVSDADVLQFREQVRQGKRVDFSKETIPMDLGMAPETGFPHRGRVDYADPAADPGTGTVQARGVFPNPDHVILPGLFVRLRVPVEERTAALLVPESALGADQSGRFVLVVGRDGVVEQRPVKPGAKADDGLRIIESGLNADDLVVVNGLQRARPGAKVNPKRAGAAAPAPGEPKAAPAG